MNNHPELTDQQLAEWEQYRGAGYTSAVGEYTPEEFWWLLDEVKRLRAANASPCQYASDVGMPEYRCAGACQYKKADE